MSSGLSTLAVKNDVFPFDGADMLQETDVDVFAFRNGARRDIHEPIEIVEAFTRRPTTKRPGSARLPIRRVVPFTNGGSGYSVLDRLP
jgi:hypothetical protein